MAKATKAETSEGWDPSSPCPACKELVHMYVPPDRSLGGPIAYPSLLLHYEARHAGIAPPAAPAVDAWDVMPPAPGDWQPMDRELAKKQLPQSANVWPPVRMPRQNPE